MPIPFSGLKWTAVQVHRKKKIVYSTVEIEIKTVLQLN